jgi:tRNA uridine 5-carboxymethylaminomethyl modification enzyme
MGVTLRRYKTGTPARMDKRSLDFSKMEEQKGDEKIIPFSFSTNPEEIQKDQVSCYLTYTNEETHKIIRANLDRSPIYAGIIEGTGPRYCPSIEDKVVKFADKERHQVFIEPEGLYTNEMYVGGMSSSLPEDVQLAMYRTVPGLENCRIVRNAYAIEYDCITPGLLTLSLEIKGVSGLFSAGQFNGSSGYEEAAAQGLIAGINAARKLQGKEPLILDRSEAYIGVLIDDLVTKENLEPYRMMTSRAEYRLLLRQDNADFRLRKFGYEVGLVTKEQLDYVLYKDEKIKAEVERLKTTFVGSATKNQEYLESLGSAPLRTGTSLAELLCRPEITYENLSFFDKEREELSDDIIEQVCIRIKYEGYIERQERQVAAFKKMEKKHIPENINYDDVSSLRLEARQKLKLFKPMSVGQASRISGVTPADVSVLLIYLASIGK